MLRAFPYETFMELAPDCSSEGGGAAAAAASEEPALAAGTSCHSYCHFLIRKLVPIHRDLYTNEADGRYWHLRECRRVLHALGLEEHDDWDEERDEWEEDRRNEGTDSQRWNLRACACILASCRFLDQAELFSRARLTLLITHHTAVPHPRPVFLGCGSDLSHANLRLHIRCGVDSFVVYRLAYSHSQSSTARLRWSHAIIARLQPPRRRHMLDTLHCINSIVHSGYAYKSLAGHDPHSYDNLPEYVHPQCLTAEM